MQTNHQKWERLNMDNKYKTREEWLEASHILLSTEVFKPKGYNISDSVVFSCSFATTGNRLGAKSTTLGQCFPPQLSENKLNTQIVISPLLDDAIRVLDIQAHELCHHHIGCEHKHNAKFKAIRKSIGLYGRKKDSNDYIPNGASTDTKAGPELETILNKIVEELGPYPHSKLDTTGRKKQTTRNLLVECSTCGIKFRGSKKSLENGAPHCSILEHGRMDIIAD